MPRAASPLKSVRGQQSQRGARQSKGAASLVDIAGQPLLDLVPEDPPEGSADDDAEPKFDAMDEIQWLRDELAAKAQELSDKDRELAELRARLQSGGSLPQPTCKSILIDMDNTICDFDGEVVRRFTEKFPGQTMLTTSAATRKNWGIAEDVGESYSEEVKKIFRESGFAESLPPIAGAVNALKEMLAEGYDVRLCTSPLIQAPHGAAEKLRWVRAHLGEEWVRRVVITSDKTLVRGAILIDDKIVVEGERVPKRMHIIFGRPYQEHHAQSLERRCILGDWSDWRRLVEQARCPSMPTSFDELVARARSARNLGVELAQDWTLTEWLRGVDCASIIADALRASLPREAPAAVEYALLCELGRQETASAMLSALQRTRLDASLASQLHKHAKELVHSPVHGDGTVDENNDKFTMPQMQLGDLRSFFGGLDGLIGPPSPNLWEKMRREHCEERGAADAFTSSNYRVTTSSVVEWWFVVKPEEGLKQLRLSEWPVEHQWSDPDHKRPRTPRPLASFASERRHINQRLSTAGSTPLLDEEFVGLRLCARPSPARALMIHAPPASCMHARGPRACVHARMAAHASCCSRSRPKACAPHADTGPMYVRYNSVLRASALQYKSGVGPTTSNSSLMMLAPATAPAAAPAAAAVHGAEGFTSTIHAIASGIIKLGKLVSAGKVYRGIGGVRLPDE